MFAVLSLLLFLLMQLCVGALHWYEPKVQLVYGRDIVLLVVLVMVLAHTRLARVTVWVASLLGGIIVLFEWVRAVGIQAMAQEPLLYDAVFLGKHLYILLGDLLGDEANRIILAVVGALFFAMVVFRTGFGIIAAASKKNGWAYITVMAVFLGGAVSWAESDDSPVVGRDTLRETADNLQRSHDVWQSLQTGLDGSLYEDIASLELKKKPRVHVYIIESYGRASIRGSIRDRYTTYMSDIEQRIQQAGWHIATGLSEAPVMGGRSWLADATMLSGVRIRYESEYRHLSPQFSEMTTLPGFFRRNGYETIVMRPKDRARPGLELVNYFDYTRTVFWADLDYKGRQYGWVGIPDQYSLGHIRDVVMPDLEAPEFVFAHLGSSHLPWTNLPPVMRDWRLLSRIPSRNKDEAVEGLNEKQVRFQLGRFRRQENVRIQRLRATDSNVEKYLDAVTYSIEVTVRHIEDMDDPPDLIVMMGDHQPPLYRRNTDFTVPVHLFARDKRLLSEFRKNGFLHGIELGSWDERMYHEGFFSLMVRALSAAEQGPSITYRKRGNAMVDDQEDTE